MRSEGSRWKLAVHGPVIELGCCVPALDRSIQAMLGSFAVPGWPEGFTPMSGTVRPYDIAEVSRHLSSSARHLLRTQEMLDIYEEEERFWLVDDRWGMAELNLLRGQWRSWILPVPKLDPFRVVEYAVLWPMAQLLRARGIHLLPAASVVRDGFAALIVCPFNLEPELTAMIGAGYRVIGQRWTALREEDGRQALLHVPGRVERSASPRLRVSQGPQEEWLDLGEQYLRAWQNHAFCDAVLVGEAGRRSKAHLREVAPADAIHLLRSAWPIVDLHPSRRPSPLPARLAQSCRVAELQLSRNSKDLLALLNSFRYASSMGGEEQSAAA